MNESQKLSRVLVTGARGMLAGDFIPLLRRSSSDVLNLTLGDIRGGEIDGLTVHPIDITDRAACETLCREFQPQWIVNLAAFTAVDDAETKKEAAFAVNGDGPANLARAAKAIGARVAHISTDYVFGADVPYGSRRPPYKEDEKPNPCGVYGASKLAGEENLREILPEHFLIVRTSWLHGLHGPNFVHTMLKLADEKEELRIVNDQCGSPTWTGWLSQVLLRLISENQNGIFHASGQGDVTWFEFAKEIFRQAGKTIRVLPQTTAELNRPAPRPAYSTFDLTKLERVLGEPCITYQDALAQHLREYAKRS